jgi:mitochondrial pyruvate carrier 2
MDGRLLISGGRSQTGAFHSLLPTVSSTMTVALSVYSALFMRFAWVVKPRNYILLSCHVFNESMQLTQLYRRYQYDKSMEAKGVATDSFRLDPTVMAAGVAATAVTIAVGPLIQAALNKGPIPAGPFTVFFWAPIGKWSLSGSNILEYKKPVDKMSGPIQTALTFTGLIWTRYALVITPVNYSLAAVNFALFGTGSYHLARKYIYDPFGTAA